jgi:hypothetical protein
MRHEPHDHDSFSPVTTARPDLTHRATSVYPAHFMVGDGYPTEDDFVVARQELGKGYGVYARRAFQRGYRVCRISGMIVHEVMQHTLQISTDAHLYDPYFTGFLLHACDPNVFLDMGRFELWAMKDILPGQALTMDYASTEDYLFKQFPCLCGAPNCRKWITGRREPVRVPDLDVDGH